MIHVRFLALGLVALLAACGDNSTPAEGRLQGEVLDGTISDAMIHLDQVKSQAPLAGDAGDPGETGPAGAAPAVDGAGSEAEAVDAEQPTPVPAETPVTTTDGQTG